MALTNTIFLDACRGASSGTTPVWFMRQAGRSLPEYRAIRGSGDILRAIASPELVAEITLQPVRRHGVDAAILFSDIMVPLASIGLGIEIAPGKGPVIASPFKSRDDLQRLRPLEPTEDTPFVLEAIRHLVEVLNVPLIGFAGAPFTLAAYLIEGGPSKTYAKTKALMKSDPELWAELLGHLASISLTSLRSQVEAGCTAVQVFDSWAGNLTPHDYETHVLPATRRIFAGLKDLDVPSIHFGVGTGELLTLMAEANPDVMGVDWRVPLGVARERVGGRPVQGNLDPSVCLAPWDVVSREVDRVLIEAGSKAHIFNLGHGVLPETDPDTLTRVVEHVHERRS